MSTLSGRSFNSGFDQGDDVVRLHLNENPYGASPRALAVVRATLAHGSRYPDSDIAALRERVSAHVGVGPDQVVVGNGTDELILLSALALLGPGKRAVVSAATFPGYATSAAVAGAHVVTAPPLARGVSADALTGALAGAADVVYVCNPHNPCGTALSADDFTAVLAAAGAAGAVPVFDEAYMEFAGPAYERGLQAVRDGARAVVTRTFSKAYGLASLRVGYAVGPADLIARLAAVRMALPFNVNRLAQAAAVAALDDQGWLDEVHRRNAETRDRLGRHLDDASIAHGPSVTNFVLVDVGGDSGAVAAALLREHRTLVRDCEPFGLPGCLRVTVGTPGQVDEFAAALGKVLAATNPHRGKGKP